MIWVSEKVKGKTHLSEEDECMYVCREILETNGKQRKKVASQRICNKQQKIEYQLGKNARYYWIKRKRKGKTMQWAYVAMSKQ